jgi:hypothetical protein
MPQNSSTESNEMTSFSKSFQLSPCGKSVSASPAHCGTTASSFRIGVKTDLATWRFREPQGPFVEERVLDIEVVWIMEDGDWSARVNGRGAVIAAGSVSTAGSILRRNGNGIQRDW